MKYAYLSVEDADHLRIHSVSESANELEVTVLEDAANLCGNGFEFADDEREAAINAAWSLSGYTLEGARPGMSTITLYLRTLDVESSTRR